MRKAAAGLAFLACFGIISPEGTWCPLAGSSIVEAGAVQDEDFSYQGLKLGDSEERMREILGEPLFDKPQTILGVSLKVCEYQDVKVGVAKSTGKVVDIALSGEKSTLRRGVRYGATSYWLQKVYGQNERQWQGGVPYLIYTRSNHRYEHLLLALDSDQWCLDSVRITALPLTEDEADMMVIEGADVEEGLEAAATEVNSVEGKIDMSSLPKEEPAKLKIGGKAE